ADLGAGGSSENILIRNDIEQRRSPQLIFFLLGVKRLLVEVPGLCGGLQRYAGLLENNLSIMNIDRDIVHDLAVAGFVLTCRKQRRHVVALSLSIPDRDRQTELRVVLGIGSARDIGKGTWQNRI